MGLAGEENGIMGGNSAGFNERPAESEPLQHLLAAPADELPANPVARVTARLKNRDGYLSFAKPDAEGQTGQAAANDFDGLKRCHVFLGLVDAASRRPRPRIFTSVG